MARAPGKKSSKTRRASASAARGRTSAKKTAGKKPGAQKRSAGKRRSQRRGASGDWLGAVTTLVGSPDGRAILAEVFESVAATLRKQREAVTRTTGSGAAAISETAGSAVDAATEMATGTVNLAQTAAAVLADVVGEATRSVLPGSSKGDEDEDSGSEQGSR
jgi:hypothetical protein